MFDRVGQGVAISGNVIAVSARANYSGVVEQLHPRFEVQQIAITAAPGSVVGRTFKLGWKKKLVGQQNGVASRGEAGTGDREPYV